MRVKVMLCFEYLIFLVVHKKMIDHVWQPVDLDEANLHRRKGRGDRKEPCFPANVLFLKLFLNSS